MRRAAASGRSAACRCSNAGGEELYPVQIGLVGRYAVSIEWSDGHDTGIYSYQTLRALCPCATCAAATSVQAIQPARANVDSPNNYWTSWNFSLLQGPPAACYPVYDPSIGKYLVMIFDLPMAEWQGLGDLQAKAEYFFWKWSGYEWLPYNPPGFPNAMPTFIDWSHQSKPAFSFKYGGDMLFYASVGGASARQQIILLEDGYYYVELTLSLMLQDAIAFPIPISGPGAYSKWICGPQSLSQLRCPSSKHGPASAPL